MRQAEFEAQREEAWNGFAESLRKKRKAFGGTSDFPGSYREVSRDLALARERRYSPALLDRLNGLVLEGHQKLYHERRPFWSQALEFLAFGFPRMVRARWQRFFFCMLSFCIPFGLLWVAGRVAPEWVFALLGDAEMASLDESWATTEHTSGRDADHGFMAFAFYIRNNVGIDFQVFAGGVLAGLGSLFILGYNALLLGAAFGYVAYAGYHAQFMPFVSGHAALEITGIWLSALAGLELGFAWLAPGRKSRRYAIVEGAKSGLLLLSGAATMTALAAVVEGFWSPSAASPILKYWVGGVMWVLVFGYLALAGRRNAT